MGRLSGGRYVRPQVLRRLAPALYPLLFAAFPLLSLFEHNQSEIELAVLWVPLIVTVAAAAGLYALLCLVVRRDAAKAAALTALVVFAFFYYGTFASAVGLADRWFFPLWAVLFILLAAGLAWIRRDLTKLTWVLGAAALVLVVNPVARIAIYHANHPGISVSDVRLWRTHLPLPVKRGPDIYVLVPDDYARPDVLRQYFRYHDERFLHGLEQRGFVVSQQSRSPYSDSELNTAASVNMDYLSGFPKIPGRTSQDVRPVPHLAA